MSTLLRSFLRDRFLHILLLLGVLLTPFARFGARELVQAIDWQTIITLAGLLLLTKGIETSGYFDVIGRRLVARFRHQRGLALLLVATSALLSTFLTNDVALFITVPLTLSLRKYSRLPVARLIIFEALAVNTGSLLTPIGNPQNILLWSHGGLGFFAFIGQMLPLGVVLMVLLLLLTAASFRAQPMALVANDAEPLWQRGLLVGCALLYPLFITALEFNLALPALLIIALFFLLRERRILLQPDWSLLAVFIMMFIDVFLLTRLPPLTALLQQVPAWGNGAHFLLAIGLSQTISNVPATILLLNILPASPLLAWAVNIGGFGLLPGSLANLIALRMAQERAIWWQFHLFSLPVLFVAMLAGWITFLIFHAI